MTSREIIIEAAVDSVATATMAVAEGATRLELCGDLTVGGVTPPDDLLDDCGTRFGVPVAVMIRPRGGDFIYDASDVSAMCSSITRARRAGAQAIVTGALRPRGTLDTETMMRMREHAENTPLVCHRAFDQTPDLDASLETLAELGADRVLTGGGPGAAFAGRATLRRLVERAAGRLTILAGGGVRGDHAAALVHESGVVQVHARGTAPGTIAAIVRALAVTALVAAATACRPAPPPLPFDRAAWLKQVEDFQAWRLRIVNGEEGWTTVTGLSWLRKGEQTIGGDSTADVRLPTDHAPARVGTLTVIGDTTVIFRAARAGIATVNGAKGAAPTPVDSIIVQSDSAPAPTQINVGSVSFRLLHRVDKLGIRVRDREALSRKNFAGLVFYPADSSWYRVATLERAAPGTTMPIINVLGQAEPTAVVGTLTLTVDGRDVRLIATQDRGDTNYRVMFKDASNGRGTYDAGRYLTVHPADADGRVILDFNRAFTPPCAYTPYATCPLPPPQNRIAVAVHAGEQGHAEH